MITGIWEIHTAIVVALTFIFVIYSNQKKLGGPFAFTWAYSVAVSSIVFFWPDNNLFPAIPDFFKTNMRISAGWSLILLTLPFIVFLKRQTRLWLTEFICWVCLINGPLSQIYGGGIFNVDTFDLTMTAIATSYFIYKGSFWASMIGCLIVAVWGGSTSIITLCVAIGAFILNTRNSFRFLVFLLPTVAIGTFKIESFKTRLVIWQESMTWWIDNALIEGLGPGSFATFGSQSTFSSGENPLWMHNDYLEFIFQYGLIGLVMLISCLWYIYKKVWGTRWIPTSAIATACLGYFPMQFTLSQILCILIIWEMIE